VNTTTNRPVCPWCNKLIYGEYSKARNKPYHVACAAAQKLWWDRENMKEQRDRRFLLIHRLIQIMGFLLGSILFCVGAVIIGENTGVLGSDAVFHGIWLLFGGMLLFGFGIYGWMVVYQENRDKSGKGEFDDFDYYEF